MSNNTLNQLQNELAKWESKLMYAKTPEEELDISVKMNEIEDAIEKIETEYEAE